MTSTDTTTTATATTEIAATVAAAVATVTPTATKIEVGSNLENVNWTTNAVLVPCDNIAFSDPHASSPSGKFYIISRETAKMSNLLKDILEDKADGEIVEIPIPKINGKTLSTIMMYMNYFVDNKAASIPKPLNTSLRSYLSEWEKNFLDNFLLENGNEKEHHVLIDVLAGAHFLTIESLTSLSCAAVADMMKGKTTEQIRELFNIENDFTPEEEEQIRKETKWCDETE
jgi:S-phase kinase-associated protein 1